MSAAVASRRHASPSAPGLAIVPAAPRHASACATILDDWIEATEWVPRLHDRASIEWFVGEVVFAMRHAWVAERGGETVGFIAVSIENEVTALHVRAADRGAGTGRALLDRARRAHPEGLTLWTFRANEGARRFYAREGFREIARTDGDNEERLPDIRLEWRAA